MVRCDDRRIEHQGESVLLSEINEKLDQDVLFQSAGRALYHGKKVRREVAEVEVTLKGRHRTRINGKQIETVGAPIPLRAVFVRLVDSDDYILAEWTNGITSDGGLKVSLSFSRARDTSLSIGNKQRGKQSYADS
ncbi:MAG: hypothetical protein MUD03_14585 [Pirellula sp.]|nr:hypothetical protein [Pirellula sp.]